VSKSHIILAGQRLASDQILVYHRQSILVRNGSYTWSFEQLEEFLEEFHAPVLISDETGPRFLAVHLDSDSTLPPGSEFVPMRTLLVENPDSSFRIPGLGNQLLNWYHSHRFCGVCGHPTEPHSRERALICSSCQKCWYPRISPCVIVLVTDGEKFLLARHARYRLNLHTCLAGFVEVGETPEQTVAREVREEAGIEISNIRYVKSQSWPFPSQLMLGFFADYQSGELRPDQDEIEDLQWFLPEELPVIPSPHISVAGQLIHLHCEKWRKGQQQSSPQ